MLCYLQTKLASPPLSCTWEISGRFHISSIHFIKSQPSLLDLKSSSFLQMVSSACTSSEIIPRVTNYFSIKTTLVQKLQAFTFNSRDVIDNDSTVVTHQRLSRVQSRTTFSLSHYEINIFDRSLGCSSVINQSKINRRTACGKVEHSFRNSAVSQ